MFNLNKNDLHNLCNCHWCKRVRGLKSLNDRLNLAHLLGLIGVHTKDQ